MKILAALAVVAVVAGCVDPMAVNPGTSIELMKGHGAASVSADGKRSFRYVFAHQAGSNRNHHEAMISQWAAKSDGCPGGYSITNVEAVQGMTVYSGPCK